MSSGGDRFMGGKELAEEDSTILFNELSLGLIIMYNGQQ